MHRYQQNNQLNSLVSLSAVRSDLADLRSANPDLDLIVSLGGEAVGPDAFSSLAGNEFKLDNLTSSLNDLYRNEVIDGVEVNWEWPLKSGDKEDRAKLVRIARVRQVNRKSA